MLFYSLFVEPYSANQIKIYGREVFEQDKKRHYGQKKCIIVDIDPEYLHYCHNFAFLEEKFKNIQHQVITKKNYFYDDIPVDVRLFKNNTKNLKSIIQKKSEDDKIEEVKTFIEFNTLAEQFVIQKKIKGPCVLDIKEIDESHAFFHTKFDSITVVESNVDFPTLKIGSCFSHENVIKVNIYEIIDRKYKLEKTVNFNQLTDEMDIIAHHNMRITNRPGVWIVDTFDCAKILVKGRSFSLDEIVTDNKCEDKTFQALLNLNILDLSKELSEITGHFIQKTISLRAERTELLLMNWMYTNNWLIYNKTRKYFNKAGETQKHDDHIMNSNMQNEHSYAGGLVLSPITGLYKNVILIDFNSLYPSIVIEKNLCFSTRKNLIKLDKELVNDNPRFDFSLQQTDNQQEMSLLPKILHTLIQRRKNLKKQLQKLKNTDKDWHVYDARQKALKITANSIYGCLGSQNRFCDVNMAAYITSKGRDLLRQAKEEVEKLGYSVIYGDTDSLMIHLKDSEIQKELQTVELNRNHENKKAYEDSLEPITSISRRICQSMNQLYNHIVIELEEIFSKIILLTKKKYAGLTKSGDIILKGIEKRDNCKLSNDFLFEIINVILKHEDIENKNDSKQKNFTLNQKLMQKLVHLKNNLENYPYDSFIMEKLLAKHPELYKTPQGSAHVMLALKVNEFLKKKTNSEQKENIQFNNKNLGYTKNKLKVFKKNDIISYVIGDKNEAFLPSDRVKINYDYYLSTQLLAPFFKIISTVGGINTDAMKKLFNIQIQKQYDNNFTIITKCCRNTQKKTDQCLKCKESINKVWLRNQIYSQLIERINSLYKRVYICPECEHQQEIKLRCFNCNSNRNILENLENKNKEFDLFLSETSQILGNEFDHILRLSEYRIVDLNLFFHSEIERAKSEFPQ